MKSIRVVIIIVLLAGLCWMGWDLYHRQNENYQLNSFVLADPITEAHITDLNRFIKKANPSEMGFQPDFLTANAEIAEVFDVLKVNESLNFNLVFGRSCYLSLNASAYTITFDNTDFSIDEAAVFLNENLGIDVKVGDAHVVIAGVEISYAYFGTHVVFSNQPITYNDAAEKLAETNADYVVYSDTITIEKHILANGQEYRVWQDTGKFVRGRPIEHFDLISKIPASFDEVIFHASQRFEEDQHQFFKDPQMESFSWIRNQMAIVKKDSFELILAPQNEQRSLRLILEEQTLKANSDSGQIAFFNLKNFEIMPFEPQDDWKKAIVGVGQDMKFYTEFEDINVLSNSLEALLWYLSEIQSSGLLRDNDDMMGAVQLSTPLRCHYMNIKKMDDDALDFRTITWKEKTTMVYTASTAGKLIEFQEEREDFEIPINVPVKQIIPHKKGLYLICQNEVRSYDFAGEIIGKSTFDAQALLKYELIDLENDGNYELAIFAKTGLFIFNTAGKTIRNITVQGGISGGMLVNYDQKYDYRFFLTSGKKVWCYNEAGTIVNGFQFAGSATPLTGDALYGQFAGKDYLVFEGSDGQHYALNRRGEARFQKTAKWNIGAPAPVLTGKNEGTLSRLGYSSNYIYNHYLKDGTVDSLELDQQVTPTNAYWINEKEPTLVIDEPGRVVLFSQFGYKTHEVLKPLNAKKLLNVEKMDGFYFVFFDNVNNRIYLLDQDGNQLTNEISALPGVYGITNTRFYIYDGVAIKVFKLK